MNLKVDVSQVAELYQTLDKIGALGQTRESGYLRAAYSAEETAAMKFIEEIAIQCGARTEWDSLKNLSLDWAGKSLEFVEVGSHLDTVPNGGNFDGVAGIVAGLLAIRTIINSGIETTKGLRLRIWRGEESGTFGIVYGGSKGAFGQLDPLNLAYKFQEQTYEAAMKSQGADPEIIRNKKRTISQEVVDQIYAHLELHIEQATLLEHDGLDVGIVTSIRGPKRFRVVLEGGFDHSGATPMGVNYRKDVNLAMAYIQVELDKLLQTYVKRGEDLVQTIGVINCSQDFNNSNPAIYSNALTTISGFGYFTWDIRSNCKDTLDRYSLEATNLVSSVSAEFKVSSEIKLLTVGSPLETMNEEIQDVMEKSAKALGISSIRMASGAGHDAAIVAQQARSDGTKVPVGMLFIPCRNGTSHSPDEYTTFEAIAKGASVLASGMLRLAQ